MPSTKIPSFKVPVIDSSTGLISREWYRFFLNITEITGVENNDLSLSDLIVQTINSVDNTTEGQSFLDTIPAPIELISESKNTEALVQELTSQLNSIGDELSSIRMVPEIGTLAYQNSEKVNVKSLYINTEPVVPTLSVYKTTSESRNSTTTISMDSELVLTLKAGGVYKFSAAIFFNTVGAAEGIKIGLDGTSTVTLLRGQVSIWDDTADTLSAMGILSFLSSSTVSGVTGAGNNYAVIDGIVKINAGGTFGLSWAQSVSGANNTTVSSYSNIIAMRIG